MISIITCRSVCRQPAPGCRAHFCIFRHPLSLLKASIFRQFLALQNTCIVRHPLSLLNTCIFRHPPSLLTSSISRHPLSPLNTCTFCPRYLFSTPVYSVTHCLCSQAVYSVTRFLPSTPVQSVPAISSQHL